MKTSDIAKKSFNDSKLTEQSDIIYKNDKMFLLGGKVKSVDSNDASFTMERVKAFKEAQS